MKTRKLLAALITATLVGAIGLTAGAQTPPPGALNSGGGGAGRARGTDAGCTTEERDVSVDCGLQIREPEPLKPAKMTAPLDLTGYWTSVISEDWRWRVLTPPKGDYISLPLNKEGVRVADSWDPKDVGSCKPYGAAGLMRNPTRVRFEWQDDNTLKLETDHGQQTRLFHFNAKAPAADQAHTLQGYSVASWDMSALKVVTTHLTAGYLRKNGVPYSENAKLTEYYNRYTGFDQEWMTITTIVEDPKYLTRTFNTSLDFKRLKDGSAWKPTPCGTSSGT